MHAHVEVGFDPFGEHTHDIRCTGREVMTAADRVRDVHGLPHPIKTPHTEAIYASVAESSSTVSRPPRGRPPRSRLRRGAPSANLPAPDIGQILLLSGVPRQHRPSLSRRGGDEISTVSADDRSERLVFAPTAPRFGGRVIVFDLKDDHVERFTAGTRDAATAGPCPWCAIGP
ncbi:hypothetical protein ACPB9J_09935 [Streptomyces lavendulocolor]|uniref:hypothetical protein n=1 Tax=Streptomyces lavendulocolor TaxID=67316 RepID=UPI003C2C1A69